MFSLSGCLASELQGKEWETRPQREPQRKTWLLFRTALCPLTFAPSDLWCCSLWSAGPISGLLVAGDSKARTRRSRSDASLCSRPRPGDSRTDAQQQRESTCPSAQFPLCREGEAPRRDGHATLSSMVLRPGPGLGPGQTLLGRWLPLRGPGSKSCGLHHCPVWVCTWQWLPEPATS